MISLENGPTSLTLVSVLEIRFNLFVQIFPQRSENIALCILEKK
jgi:hypothetical protein